MRRALLVAAAILSASLGSTSFAAVVVYHTSSTGSEDGVPGFDPDATSYCENHVCVGGTRDGMSCTPDSDCPDEPDGIVEWSADAVHVIQYGYAVSGRYNFETNSSDPIELRIVPGTIVKIAHTCTRDGSGNIVSCTPQTIGGGELGVGVTAELYIDGATITDIRDDTVGGDTNNDGSATTPAPSYGVIFNGSGNATLTGSIVRYAREVGRIGSMLIQGNSFYQFGGMSGGYGFGAGIQPPVPGSVPLITANDFEFVANSGGPNTVDLRGTSPIVDGNFFTGAGTALTIGPAWEDPYYYKGAIPEAGTTIVTRNVIESKHGIVTDPPGGGGGNILEQVRFHAQIIGNELDGPGGNESVGLRLALFSDTLAQFNSVESYASPLILSLNGVTLPPTAVTAALMGLTLNDNTFSLDGALTGPSQSFEAFWKTFGQMVNAEHNWWGHYSGPKDTSNADSLVNPLGLGLTVTNGIDYRPFLGAAPTNAADSITIAATSDPPPPLATDLHDVSVTVSVDYELQTAATGSVRVSLRNLLGEVLNPPFTSVPVTSSGTHVDVGPIVLADVPEYSPAITVEAVLVPAGTDSEEVPSNVTVLAVLPPKRSFKLECASDAEKPGDCPPIALIPAVSFVDRPQLKMNFVYTYNSSDVDAVVDLSIRRKGTGELLDPLHHFEFSGAPGFQVYHPVTKEIPLDLVANPGERELVILYGARDVQGVEIGSGVRKIPILDEVNAVYLSSVSALASLDVPRGFPGHMLIGEFPQFALDLYWRIGTPGVTDWHVLIEARAVDAAGSTLQNWYFATTPAVSAASTGSGEVKDWQSLHQFQPAPIPAGTTRVIVDAKLRTSTGLNVHTSSWSIPAIDAADVVSKAIPAGASEKSFHPIPATMSVQSNQVDGLVALEQIFAPLTDDLPFAELNSQQLETRSAVTRGPRTTGEQTLIPLNRHFAIYDTLTDVGLSAAVTFEYDPEEDFPDAPGFDSDTLVIAVRNPLSGRLEALPSTHDTIAHTVTADYDGFFGLWTIASDATVPVATCADPTADGQTTATDALFALRASVGSTTCLPCICDTNRNGSVSATDALVILKYAVGQTSAPTCVACG